MTELSRDGVLDILRTEIRREVIRTLDDSGGVSRGELVSEVAESIGRDDEEVEIALYHGHIPLLIKWDVLAKESGEINPGENFAEVIAYLETIEQTEE